METKMRSTLALASLALVIGLVLGAVLTYGSYSAATRVNVSLPDASMPAGIQSPWAESPRLPAADLIELDERLQHEIEARRALERRVALLTGRVEALVQKQSTESEQAPSPRGAVTQAPPHSDPGQNWFNEQLLIENGMDRVQAGLLRARYEQLELERLYLRNQSRREGWDRQRLRDELRAVERKESEIKEQLGEDAYDAYRFAAGLPNRVAVTSVLPSAQAGEAGIEPGDFIMRYDDERIYDWFDLQEATAAGQVGEMVSLEVERDGETLQFYLQRGPLGIRMDSLSVGPATDLR